MVESMAPDNTARENLFQLIDKLFGVVIQAGMAREQYDLLRTRELLDQLVRMFEELRTLLDAVDEAARNEIMPILRQLAAAEALLHANTHAGSHTLEENRVYYGLAISAAERVTDSAFQGRARSCYGAVLLHFDQYNEAAQELQLARQLLRTEELGNWVQATRRLAQAYDGLGRRTDAIAVLQETTHPFESPSYQRPEPVTSHHIEAAVLLARLLARNGQRRAASNLLGRVQNYVRNHQNLVATPEFQQLQFLRAVGFWRFTIYQWRKPRQLHI